MNSIKNQCVKCVIVLYGIMLFSVSEEPCPSAVIIDEF